MAEIGELSVGDRVIVLGGDGDGSEGLTGVVAAVYKSGRCEVHIGNPRQIRNLHPTYLEKLDGE